MCFAAATAPGLTGFALTMLLMAPAWGQEAERPADKAPTPMERAQREADRVFQVIRKSAPAPQNRPAVRPAPPQAARAPLAPASQALAKATSLSPLPHEVEQVRNPVVLEAPAQTIAPPAASPLIVASPPGADAAEAAYVSQVLAYLESIKRYPSTREAREKRPSGTVRIWISVQRSGQLGEAGVEASSGSMILDNEALRSVRSGRYPPFPNNVFAGQPSRRFVVGMAYALSGGQ
jgi:protein TonB